MGRPGSEQLEKKGLTMDEDSSRDSFSGSDHTSHQRRAQSPRPPTPDPSLASRESKPARRCRCGCGCRVPTVGLVPADTPSRHTKEK